MEGHGMTTNEEIARKAAEDILRWRLTTTVTGATKIILEAMEKSKITERVRMLEVLATSGDYDDED